jgi:putative flavoprotein involved in K+ transport
MAIFRWRQTGSKELDMQRMRGSEHHDTIVIGGGQAGLAAGYHLKRRGRDFLILDASRRVGDAWRNRWDSLRLFTPARFNSLPGRRFPAHPHYFPTKDEMAAYLEQYAQVFELPVRSDARVDRLAREDGGYMVEAAGHRYEADNVIVAMANYQRPWRPPFAAELDTSIRQIHSAEYRNPTQLRPGRVLIVGAGNSAAEIARELAPRHAVTLSGRNTGQLPFRIDSRLGRSVWVPLTLRGLFLRVLNVNTPVGRKARPKIVKHGGPLIRVKRKHLTAVGVTFVGRTAGVREGRPLLDDGRVLDVENVVWCTGFRPGFEQWIDLPIHGEHEPRHHAGIVRDQPGLYFLGLEFLRSLSSVMVHGVGSDAEYIARTLDRRPSRRRSTRLIRKARTVSDGAGSV